jgi:cell division septal protein FtsQ
MAPITSRGIQPFADAQSITSPAARRQHQAAISMPGIEVRMPAISFTSRSLKWRLGSITLSVALVAVLYMAWNSTFFRVPAAQVSGNVRNSAQEIGAALEAAGEPSFMLVPADLQRRLRLNFPEIVSARIQVAFPNSLTIQVIERTPVVAWQQGNGYTWIDDNGVAFRPQGSADNLIAVSAHEAPPRGLPSLSDPLAPIPYLTTDVVQAIKELASNVPAGATMLYDSKYGLGWADSHGWQVFFGTDDRDLATKLKVYEALVTSLTAKGVTPAFISVQYANAPYYRMSQ